MSVRPPTHFALLHTTIPDSALRSNVLVLREKSNPGAGDCTSNGNRSQGPDAAKPLPSNGISALKRPTTGDRTHPLILHILRPSRTNRIVPEPSPVQIKAGHPATPIAVREGQPRVTRIPRVRAYRMRSDTGGTNSRPTMIDRRSANVGVFLRPPTYPVLPTDRTLRAYYFRSEVQFGQRVALIGIAEQQKPHSLVLAGAASGAFLIRFTCFTIKNITKATIRKSRTVLRKIP
jgi:hypothetical protein